jgi:CheY-like chemotaxis protein
MVDEGVNSDGVVQYLHLLSEEARARTAYLQRLSGPLATAPAPKEDQVADALLKYSQFIREETKSHRAFLESLYTISTALLGGIIIVFGAVLAWLNWKTKREIRNQVEEQFKTHAQSVIKGRLQAFNEDLKRMQGASEQQIQNANRLLMDLAGQATFLEAAPSSSTSSARSVPHKLKGKRILWVDEHPENNDYPREILEQQGVRCTSVLSTEDAEEMLKDNSFDLIISDMGRGYNRSAGLDLVKSESVRKSKIPVIIFASPKAIDTYGQRALEAGARYATDGFGPLLQAVTRLLTENKVTQRER